jgi:hypothetical protein
MLLTLGVLNRIVAGEVSLVYRRWTKPTVREGGRLRTAVGELSIGGVRTVEVASISDTEAALAGWASAAELIEDLFRERPTSSARGRGAKPGGDRSIYRIEVSFAGTDRRFDLRADDQLTDADLVALVNKLDGYDARSSFGPWTRHTLSMIHEFPARRAPELAEMQGRETIPFKADVRKLKEMGLTESLPVGYQLSPRGKRVFAALISS